MAETSSDGSKKILNLMIQKLNLKLSVDRYYLTDNPERRCPDLSKSKLLGYYCKVNIKQGIENYLNFLKYENNKYYRHIGSNSLA